MPPPAHPFPLLVALAGAAACHQRPAPSGPQAITVPPGPLQAPADPLSPESLLDTVRHLAAPGMEGRAAGGPGYDRAVRYAIARLRGSGLEPGLVPADPAVVPAALADPAREGWLQPFLVEHAAISACDLAIVRPDGTGEPLALGTDFACRGFTGSGDVTAEVVFAGHGVSDPARGHDDYAGLDVAGKVVLAFKGAPPWASPGDEDPWKPRPKAAVAAAHGAAALLLVPHPSDPQPAIGSVMDGPGPAVPIPQVQVSIPVAERLVAGTGVPLADLEARLHDPAATASGPTGERVRVHTVSDYRPAVPTVNVVGRIPGTDRASEAVVVSAHLDHVGCQGAVCWPGANDDASGSAAVIAIAGALARDPTPPRRTVYTVLYASEEHGLDGSEAFAAAPPVPVDRIVAQVNLDCIGVGDGLQVGGGKSSPRLWEIARGIDATSTKRMLEDTWWGGGADAQALFDHGVPTLYFATRNAHPHLHLPTDTVDTFDPDLFTAAVRLAWQVVAELAEGVYTGEPRQPEPPPEKK